MDNENDLFATPAQEEQPQAPAPKRRGRPRKNPVAAEKSESEKSVDTASAPLVSSNVEQSSANQPDPTAVYAPGIVPAPANEIPGELPIDAPAPEQPETLESGDNKTNNNNNRRDRFRKNKNSRNNNHRNNKGRWESGNVRGYGKCSFCYIGCS